MQKATREVDFLDGPTRIPRDRGMWICPGGPFPNLPYGSKFVGLVGVKALEGFSRLSPQLGKRTNPRGTSTRFLLFFGLFRASLCLQNGACGAFGAAASSCLLSTGKGSALREKTAHLKSPPFRCARAPSRPPASHPLPETRSPECSLRMASPVASPMKIPEDFSLKKGFVQKTIKCCQIPLV